MSEHHESFPPTSETESAPFKDDDFPGDFFDDTNEPATFDAEPTEAQFDPELEEIGLDSDLDVGSDKPKRKVLSYKIGKASEVPTPGGLVPWTLGVLTFVALGSAVLFGTKSASTAATSPETAVATPTPEPAKAAEPAVTPAEAPAAAVVAVPAVAAAVPANTPTPETTPAPAVAAAVPANATVAEVAPAAPAAMEKPGTTSVELLASELKEAKASVEGELKALTAKIDALPKSEPVDFKSVEEKIAEQGKTIEAFVPVPEKLSKVEEKLGGLDESIKSIQSDLTALKDELKKATEAIAALSAKPAPAPAPTPTVAETPAPAPAVADDAAPFNAAADLFKAGKYPDAFAAFSKLAAADPKDARVFYYTALANGCANNVWTGETEVMVNKGIELEKQGSPKTADIDAAFADVVPQLKKWVDDYRKRVAQ